MQDSLIKSGLVMIVLSALVVPVHAQERPERPARSDQSIAVEAEALLIRGLTLKRLGHNEAALEALRQAQARAPAEAAISAAIADVYAAMGDDASAVFHARRAFETEPNFLYGLQLARAVYRTGNRSEADRVVDDVARIARTADERVILQALADNSEHVDRDDGETFVPDSLDAEARFFLGASRTGRDSLRAAAAQMIEAGRASEAVSMLTDLLRHDVRVEDSWRLLAHAQFESGAPEAAAVTVADGLILFPGSVELIVTGVRANLAVGDVPAAATLVADVQRMLPELSREDGSALLVAAGDVASARGDLDSARSLWERALELVPGNTGVHDRLNQ